MSGAGAGDQLVVYTDHGALALRTVDPEEERKAAEKRIEEALELEQKLKKINEEVPTRIYNTMSSTAGAGSGTFHQYRMVRRAELNRQKRLEDDYQKKKSMEEYEARKKEREKAVEEATAKRRAKREKKKNKKKAKKGPGGPSGQAGPDKPDSSSDSDDQPAQPDLD
mmetsp:Transcript_15586/g.45956  ORF Transcript_15586/g.45956 Transcript_15586/m.45956 type:complete len:167 (-) Transcript_15586:123-623(-)